MKVNSPERAYKCNRAIAINRIFTEEAEIMKSIADNRDNYISALTKIIIAYSGEIKTVLKINLLKLK